MRFLLVAESPEEFEAWQQAQLKPAPRPENAAATEGLKVFEQMTCVNCHAIKGTIAKERVGPDLTHLASRRMLAAGIVENTPDNLHRWLANPQQVKLGAKMPNFNFTSEQLTNLLAYLETLK
jgi:cytochrome c oxidase subunit II